MSLISRIQNRLKYGLLTRSVLLRLRKLNITFTPYFLYLEKDLTPHDDVHTYQVERVTWDNLEHIIEYFPDPTIRLKTWRRRLDAGNSGLLLKDGDEMVGYTWASLKYCRGVAVRPLFELSEKQAYLFDMYVTDAYRGRRIAPLMRQMCYAELGGLGRTELYSISEYFNRPARRFKEKLGAVPVELRLGATLFEHIRFDVRLRGFHRNLPTRWWAVSNHPDPKAIS